MIYEIEYYDRDRDGWRAIQFMSYKYANDAYNKKIKNHEWAVLIAYNQEYDKLELADILEKADPRKEV